MVARFRTLCDLCREPATHVKVPVTIGNARARALDLCDGCHKGLLRPVLDALDRYGVDPTAPQPDPRRRQRVGRKRLAGPFLCRAGCNAAPLKNYVTLTQHVLKIHHITLSEYIERYGELVPLTPEEQAELVVEVRCEEAGCDAVYSTALGHRWPRQAMISHMRGHHGVIKWKPA